MSQVGSAGKCLLKKHDLRHWVIIDSKNIRQLLAQSTEEGLEFIGLPPQVVNAHVGCLAVEQFLYIRGDFRQIGQCCHHISKKRRLTGTSHLVRARIRCPDDIVVEVVIYPRFVYRILQVRVLLQIHGHMPKAVSHYPVGHTLEAGIALQIHHEGSPSSNCTNTLRFCRQLSPMLQCPRGSKHPQILCQLDCLSERQPTHSGPSLALLPTHLSALKYRLIRKGFHSHMRHDN